jgi:uncharacterized protein YqgQ
MQLRLTAGFSEGMYLRRQEYLKAARTMAKELEKDLEKDLD